MKRYLVLGTCLLAPLLGGAVTASVNTKVSVGATATLSIVGVSPVQFSSISYANLGNTDTKTYPLSVTAYSSTANASATYTLMMNSLHTSSSGNPQLYSPSTNTYIAYQVTFQPCYKHDGSMQVPATYTLSTIGSLTIFYPWSLAAACLPAPGGSPGTMTFIRSALANMPPAGTDYTDALTFMLTAA